MNDRAEPDKPSMEAKPQQQHEWLQRLVGDWSYEGRAPMEPDKPPMSFTGTESVRSVGGLWVVAEGEGKMPDGTMATTILTLGYDPQEKRYVGTWIGSMMTYLWVYEGALEADGQVLTLDSVGPNMAAPGEFTQFKDVVELKGDDRRVLRSHMLGDDGQWHLVMEANYQRKK